MNVDQQIKPVFIKYGIFLGLIYLALTIASFYFITSTQSPVLFVAAPIFFRLFIPVLVTLFLGFTGRKLVGGLWTFKQATTAIFIMFLIAFAIQFIGKDIVFDRFIEPNGAQKMQLAAINTRTTILEQKHQSQQNIDKTIAQMKTDMAGQTPAKTVGGILAEISISILFIFVFALIFGAFFKNAEYVKEAAVKR